MKYYFLACRPKQWPKNLLVFAVPLFSFVFDLRIWGQSFLTFICFCLISSSIYLINDCIDINSDRSHPFKKFRPIASGKLKIKSAIYFSILLSLLSLVLALNINLSLFLIIISYTIIQLFYCLKLKNLPILDLFCITFGFLLRAIAGGIATNLFISSWFILTVGLLSLFLAVEKRKAELRVCLEKGVITREVLKRYSLPLLLRLESLSSTSSFIMYSLWAAGPVLKGASNSAMLITVPFVLIGIFRYQLLSDPEESIRRKEAYPKKNSERPEEILLGDNGIKLTLLAWLITVLIIGLKN